MRLLLKCYVSPPAWRRGLKPQYGGTYMVKTVASRVEAWIETRIIIRDVTVKPVASRVEAWIETLSLSLFS